MFWKTAGRRVLHGAVALAVVAAMGGGVGVRAQVAAPFRPPDVPLVTFDPYLSIWSDADHLTDDATRHWTKHEQALVSLIRIDGKPFRLMGTDPQEVPALPQTGLRVFPTRSIYDFEGSGVHVTLTFMTAALPHDLNVLTRPLSYLNWTVRSTDGAPHAVSIYDSTSSELAVNEPTEAVVWGRQTMGPLTALRVGSANQPVLQLAGDSTRINWGYAYAAASRAESVAAIGPNDTLLRAFVEGGTLPHADDTRMPRPVSDSQPVLAFVFPVGRVGSAPVSRRLIVAYDEVYAIRYFGENLRPYWRRSGATPATLLPVAYREYPALAVRCVAFDQELMADCRKEGGEDYARICALAYRQCLAGTGIAADSHKQPLMFTKENTSNGDIATVDVIYPMEPIWLLLSPTLAKAALVPDLMYASSGRWRWPNAPHDLGTYPIVRGTDEGGEAMPVEESGNMILLLTAIAEEEHSPEFASQFWRKVTQWANYIRSQGFDLPNQLTTDDFAGPSAHNANLAVKAILALDGYGVLCDMRGEAATGRQYHQLARQWAARWMKAANDTDHYRLGYDRPGSWSQKYNLVWNRILHLNVFPAVVARREMAFYLTHLNPYGLPLDSRQLYTKTDWTLWTATLADNRQDFETIVSRVYAFLQTTPDRVPFSDFYWTQNAHDTGMHARPVIGGVFIRMLADPAMWRKWSSGDHMKVGNWAPIPPRPHVTVVVPTSQRAPVSWRYTTERPAAGWTRPGFDDSSWKVGPGPFGTAGTPGILPRTTWNTDDIWLRREFTVPAGRYPDLEFLVYHDEDVQIYLNGVPAGSESGFLTGYQPLAMSQAAQAILKPGAHILMAVHCHQTTGGQGIDVGLASVTRP